MRTVRSRLEQEEDRPTTLGAFDGWGGILYTVSHLAALWECDELRADAAAIVDRIPALVAKDDLLDVMSGSAGCVLALLASRRVVGSRRTLEVARYCGEHLLDSAERLECGHGWRRSGLSRPLTGLSHGAAGVGLALVELWAATRNDAFRRAAFEAFAYERSVFSDEHGNWPDLRDGVSADGAGRPCMTAWCHGAPGIGLGRLRALKLVDDTELRQEVEVALRSTLAFGFGGNHSLCHGSLGNVEFILEASLKLGDVRWTRAVDRTTARVLDDGERSGWRCANPHGIDSPELMTGLAGIGYELLRLAAPAEIPSVLLLAPPPCVVAPAPHRTIR